VNLPSIIGLLVTAQRSLSRDSRTEDAADLGRSISAMLDADLEHPEHVLVESSDNPDQDRVATVYEVSAHPTVSLAVRTASTSHRPLSKSEWRAIRRRLKLHPPRRKRWICCSRPEKRRTRKGKTIWGSVCKYKVQSGKASGSMMGSWVTLSRDASKRPREVKMNGKRMRMCTGALARQPETT